MKRRNGHSSKAVADAHENAGALVRVIASDEVDAAGPGTREIPAEIAGESSDTLTLYLREVRRTQLFTPAQEFAAATLARAGDFQQR